MTHHNNRAMRCPDCRSEKVVPATRNGLIRCRACGFNCTQEEAAKAAQRVIRGEKVPAIAHPERLTPLPFLKQQMRDTLDQHERDRIAAITVKAPFNPGVQRVRTKAGRFV